MVPCKIEPCTIDPYKIDPCKIDLQKMFNRYPYIKVKSPSLLLLDELYIICI